MPFLSMLSKKRFFQSMNPLYTTSSIIGIYAYPIMAILGWGKTGVSGALEV